MAVALSFCRLFGQDVLKTSFRKYSDSPLNMNHGALKIEVQHFFKEKFCMEKYKQLNMEERSLIQTQLTMGFNPSWIAKSLGRSVSTVTRELHRNGWERPLVKRDRGRPPLLRGSIVRYWRKHGPLGILPSPGLNVV